MFLDVRRWRVVMREGTMGSRGRWVVRLVRDPNETVDVHVLHQDVQCFGSTRRTIYPAEHW